MKKDENVMDERTQPQVLDVPTNIPGIHLWRDQDHPYDHHLLPDAEISKDLIIDLRISERLLDIYKHLPVPGYREHCIPQWYSIAIFFNFTSECQPADYQDTSIGDVLNWLDEGSNPSDPKISDFMCNYWYTLSYGKMSFGINVARDIAGLPFIPTVTAPNNNPNDWSGIINKCLEVCAEAVWNASGSLIKDGKRWIPSLVLVQHYRTGASAYEGGYEKIVNGNTYIIGDTTHISYLLDFVDLPGVPSNKVRKFWGTLCHEYGHNFLEFGDFYGPSGCTGYWDLLGDNSPAGKMSEVISSLKSRIGWLEFKRIVNGSFYRPISLELKPYTTTGEAIKVVPDPHHNPYEYFLLEYRKSIGNEPWRPDGALTEEGLFIAHINERLGISPLWLMRDAPFFDPEFADFTDNGGALWTGHGRLNGILFPQGSKNSFTRSTSPNSNFYGGRPSGVQITNIRIENDKCKFNLLVHCNPQIGWTVGTTDRCITGRFTSESLLNGEEIYICNDNSVALLIHRQAQWFAVNKQDEWIGNWDLGTDNYEIPGDFDGDGLDEIYIRSLERAGILKWQLNRFNTITIQNNRIDQWYFGEKDRELAGDFDGDGKDEIYIRNSHGAGILKFTENRLHLKSIQDDWIGQWNLGRNDREFIGKFTQTYRDEILIRSSNGMGLFYWDRSESKLRLMSIQHHWIGNWNMGVNDKHVIGDFDGDGRDEIYIRSVNTAGLIKWTGSKFSLLWIKRDDLERIDNDVNKKITFTNKDKSYVGRFLPNRDGILHRNNNSIAILTWEDNEIRIRHHLISPFNQKWVFGTKDKFALGKFQRIGRDIGDPILDLIQDNLTAVFIYNEWGTGMVGINHVQWNPNRPNDIYQEMGLTWINKKEILYNI